MRRLLIALAITFSLPVTAKSESEQAHAKREARLMADSNRVAHFLGCARGCLFSGVGRSRDPYPKTCLPWEHGVKATRIVADAIVHRDGWYYRSTHWR